MASIDFLSVHTSFSVALRALISGVAAFLHRLRVQHSSVDPAIAFIALSLVY